MKKFLSLFLSLTCVLTLVACGKKVVPIKHLDGIKEILPNAKVYILQSCKHWSVKEKPEEFFNIVQTNTKDL